MSMSKKHFQGIADVVRTVTGDLVRRSITDDQVRPELSNALADLFSEYNDNFDRQKFLQACFGSSTSKQSRTG